MKDKHIPLHKAFCGCNANRFKIHDTGSQEKELCKEVCQGRLGRDGQYYFYLQ